MTDSHWFINWCRERLACDDGLRYVKRFRSPQDWWQHGGVSSYMVWVVLFANNPRARWLDELKDWRIHGIAITILSQIYYSGPSVAEIRKWYPQIPVKRGRSI